MRVDPCKGGALAWPAIAAQHGKRVALPAQWPPSRRRLRCIAVALRVPHHAIRPAVGKHRHGAAQDRPRHERRAQRLRQVVDVEQAELGRSSWTGRRPESRIQATPAGNAARRPTQRWAAVAAARRRGWCRHLLWSLGMCVVLSNSSCTERALSSGRKLIPPGRRARQSTAAHVPPLPEHSCRLVHGASKRRERPECAAGPVHKCWPLRCSPRTSRDALLGHRRR